MTIISTTVGKNPLENRVALIINKRVWNVVIGCNLKKQKQNDLHLFQRQTFNITIIQVYAPTTNAEEAEAEFFYEDLQDL